MIVCVSPELFIHDWIDPIPISASDQDTLPVPLKVLPVEPIVSVLAVVSLVAVDAVAALPVVDAEDPVTLISHEPLAPDPVVPGAPILAGSYCLPSVIVPKIDSIICSLSSGYMVSMTSCRSAFISAKLQETFAVPLKVFTCTTNSESSCCRKL